MAENSARALVVTGGSRGIGASIVRQAAQGGWAVCFSYLRDDAAATSLLQSLRQEGHRVHAVRGDVADPGFPRTLFDETERAFGAATALVNNAGITGKLGRFADLPLDVMRRTLDVNLVGTMCMAQEAVRRWRSAQIAGRMVNISSIAATLGSPGEYVHYAASKAAVETFTIGLGKELAADGIRINAVSPGTVYTDIHAAGGAPDRPARVVGRVPMQRIGEPAEIANAVLWLLSDEASYVSSTVLRVAGGL